MPAANISQGTLPATDRTHARSARSPTYCTIQIIDYGAKAPVENLEGSVAGASSDAVQGRNSSLTCAQVLVSCVNRLGHLLFY